MVWRLQGSRSAEEYAHFLAQFQANFPNTMEYLRAIPVEKWIHYAQIKGGAATFGWRSNNMGEIGQGPYLNKLRNMHPLEFFSELGIVTFGKLTTLVEDHKTWRAQTDAQPVAGIVPFGVKLYTERVEAAANCSVQVIGDHGFVTYTKYI